MGGYYIKRGKLFAGPVSAEKLRQLAASGKLLWSDEISDNPIGPWKPVSQTQLLGIAPSPEKQLAVKSPSPPPVVIDERPASRFAIAKQVVGSIAVATGRGFVAAGARLSGVLSERARRRHEIKLAKVQADAAKGNQSSQGPMQPAGQGPITFAPQILQTMVVKNVNRSGGGCGCSGCGVVLILALLAVLWFIIYSGLQTPTH